MLSRPLLRRECAFTMVEVLVGLLLSTLVIVLLIGALIDMFSSSDRSAARSKAQRSAVSAGELLMNDLRAMRAPQREPLFTGSADNLRNLILFGQNQSNLLVHDLLVATPTRVTFYAETVNAAADAECITWQVMADGSMRRTVRAHTAGCASAGAVLQQSEVMPGLDGSRTTAALDIPEPFSYRTLEQRDPLDPDPDRCDARTRTSLTSDLQRDQALGIDMDLRSFVVSRSTRGDQELLTTASIASRQSQEYRFAIGCAA